MPSDKDKKAQYNKQYRQTHQAERRGREKQYYQSHKAAIGERRKKYQETHKAKIGETKRKYYEIHRAEIAKKTRQYRQAHLTEISERKRKYYESHKVGIIKQHTQYRQTHELEYKKYRNTYIATLKLRVLTHYGNGKCACVKCGATNVNALSIDHINGGGNKHRKQINVLAGIPFYIWLKKNNFPEGYQTLCMNCQCIKRNDNREYKGQAENKYMNSQQNQEMLCLS
jgi:hypothetical protein